MPLQHFQCCCSWCGDMRLFLALAGKKMQQCSLEAEEVKKRFAFSGSAFCHDLSALPSCLFPREIAIFRAFWPFVLELGWFASPSLPMGQTDVIIAGAQSRAGRGGEHFGSVWGAFRGQDGEYFGPGWGVFWVRTELWDVMAEQGDGGRGRGWFRCAAAHPSIALGQGRSLGLMVGSWKEKVF